MSLNLDVVIESPTESVDMKSGLDTLQGVSDAVRYITEAVLTNNVRERQTHKAKVRTQLKQSFKGSYGQVFGILLEDDKAEKEYLRLGRPVFLELMSYFLSESVYRDYQKELSKKAEEVLIRLGIKADLLSTQLRKSSLRKLHEVSEKFGYDVRIRYHKSRYTQYELAKFDRVTAETIVASVARETVEIRAAITRLNINTGNGRLLVEGTNDTVAFGFSTAYKYIPIWMKQALSDNLATNNTRGHEKLTYMKAVARPLKLRDGRIVKYSLTEIHR